MLTVKLHVLAAEGRIKMMRDFLVVHTRSLDPLYVSLNEKLYSVQYTTYVSKFQLG